MISQKELDEIMNRAFNSTPMVSDNVVLHSRNHWQEAYKYAGFFQKIKMLFKKYVWNRIWYKWDDEEQYLIPRWRRR